MNVVRIEIDTKTLIRFWLVVIGFGLAGLLIYSARTALLVIGLAFFLAIALSRPVNKLAKILPSKSRVLSTAIAYIFVILLLGVVAFLVVPPIVDQTARFVQNVPKLVESTSNQSSSLHRLIDNYHLQPEIDKVVGSVRDNIAGSVSNIGSTLLESIGSLLSVIASLILILVLSFLMLVEGPVWLGRLWSLYKNKSRRDHHRHLVADMYNVATSYITGQLTVSAIAGTVAGILVFILSLVMNSPSSLAIPSAAIVFMASLVPMFGEMIGAMVVALVLALNSLTAALVFLIFFIIYAQIEANYISPTIQSKKIALSALAILTSVTVGIYLFGILGGIISIPIAGCIKVLLVDYLANNRTTEA